MYRFAWNLFHQYLDDRAIAHAEDIESLLHGGDTHAVGVVDGYHGDLRGGGEGKLLYYYLQKNIIRVFLFGPRISTICLYPLL